MLSEEVGVVESEPLTNLEISTDASTCSTDKIANTAGIEEADVEMVETDRRIENEDTEMEDRKEDEVEIVKDVHIPVEEGDEDDRSVDEEDSDWEDDMDTEEDRGPSKSKALIVMPNRFELERMRALFPEPQTYAVNYLQRLKPDGQSCCVAILNFPIFFVWRSVVIWIKRVAKYKGNTMPDRIVRTNEGGLQCFWLLFRSITRAAAFRGFAHDREIALVERIKCEFIDLRAYNAACGRSYDAWSIKKKFELGQDVASEPLVTPSCLLTASSTARITNATLPTPETSYPVVQPALLSRLMEPSTSNSSLNLPSLNDHITGPSSSLLNRIYPRISSSTSILTPNINQTLSSTLTSSSSSLDPELPKQNNRRGARSGNRVKQKKTANGGAL